MKLLNGIAIAAFCISSCEAFPVIERQTAGGCHSYVIVSARGTLEPQGPSIGFLGMIKATLHAVPGGAEYDVVYPADFDPLQKDPYIGAHDVERYIDAGLQSCPQQRYALLGYSQGAIVVLQALQNLTSPAAKDAIKAIVLIGNPYQEKNKASTVDENGGSTTRGNDGILLSTAGPGVADLPSDGRALNICFEGDSVCNGLAYIITSAAHFLYGFSESVQKVGADFLIAKLE